MHFFIVESDPRIIDGRYALHMSLWYRKFVKADVGDLQVLCHGALQMWVNGGQSNYQNELILQRKSDLKTIQNNGFFLYISKMETTVYLIDKHIVQENKRIYTFNL